MREKETEIFETIFYPNTAGSESSSITGFLQVFSVIDTGSYRSNRYKRRQTQGANLPAGQAIPLQEEESFRISTPSVGIPPNIFQPDERG
jgi:hypothetical protein